MFDLDKKRIQVLDFACKGAFFMLACSMIVTPICLVEIGKSFSINLSQRGGLETARSIPLIFILLTIGFLVKWASVKILIPIGLYLMSLGLFLIGLSKSYPIILSSMAVLGVGNGFIEALVNPLITSIHPENPERYLNKTHAFFSIGICIGVLIFGELLSAQVSWRLLYIACSLGTLSIGLVFQFTEFPPKPLEKKKNESYIDILKIPIFWVIAFTMFFSAGSEGGLLFWTASYIQEYHSDIPRLSAFGTALFGATMAVGRLSVARLSFRFSIKKILFISSLCGILVSALLIYTNRLTWVLVLLSFAGFIVAGYWPSLLALGGKRITTDTTSLFILITSSGIGGIAAFPWVIGNLGDRVGLRGGFYTMPLLFILTALLLLIIKSGQSE